jgi:hypothetical protein
MSPAEIDRIRQLAREAGILPMGSEDEIAEALNSKRVKIRLPGDNRELVHFAGEIGEELKAKDFYRRDRTPVGINWDKARLEPISAQAFRTLSQRHLVFFKEKKIEGEEENRVIQIVKTMIVDTARAVLESWDFIDRLPEIERVNPIRLPVMRGNGAIQLAPAGYFAEARTYTLEGGVSYDEEMTYDRAREVIGNDLLGEMPYHDKGRSRSVHVAAMMTTFACGLLPRRSQRPGFVFTANDSDAGKTLCAKIAIIPVHGKVSPRGLPRKEEMRKVLDQLAMEAAPVILFDNVKGTLGGEDLEAFMSAALWQGRILGEKGGFEVENVTTCFFSGNDAQPTRDMAQRCLFVELFLEDIDSSQRKIRNVLTDARLAEPELRNRVCSALWTLVKAWDAAGRPAPPSVMPKCPEWSAMIAGIVARAGFGDPCVKPEIKSVRSYATEMQELVRKLAPEDADVEDWTFKQIMEEVKEETLFENVEIFNGKGEQQPLYGSDGEPSPAARSFFGKLFGRFDQRLFAGVDGGRLRFSVEGKGNGRKYLVTREAKAGGEAASVNL